MVERDAEIIECRCGFEAASERALHIHQARASDCPINNDSSDADAGGTDAESATDATTASTAVDEATDAGHAAGDNTTAASKQAEQEDSQQATTSPAADEPDRPLLLAKQGIILLGAIG